MSAELVLNPLTGRYVKKHSTSWLRLVAQGTLKGDPVIPTRPDPAVLEPVTVRNDRVVITDLVNVAEEHKDVLKGLSRSEIDDLLSKALYERLMIRPASKSTVEQPKRTVGRPRGISSRPVAISRSVAAPMSKEMRTKKAMMDAKAYASDSDSDDDTEQSISSADIETSDIGPTTESEPDVPIRVSTRRR